MDCTQLQEAVGVGEVTEVATQKTSCAGLTSVAPARDRLGKQARPPRFAARLCASVKPPKPLPSAGMVASSASTWRG